MRHRVYGKHLGRNKNQRTALFKGLVSSLLIYGSIQTTETKAKAIKGLLDQVVTQTKKNSNDQLSGLLRKEVKEKLVKEILPGLKGRTSGYTSLVRLGMRKGDGAMMVRMSLLTEGVKGKSPEANLAKGGKTEVSNESLEVGENVNELKSETVKEDNKKDLTEKVKSTTKKGTTKKGGKSPRL